MAPPPITPKTASSPSKPRPVVISGPSGTGKSTILKQLFADHPDLFGFSVSHTTRAPRAGEVDGVAYHFTTPANFQSLIETNAFIEHATFSQNSYGSSFAAVADVASAGKICVLDIEMEGVKQVAANRALNARFLFLAPPSMEELERRLRGRGTEDESAVRARLDQANKEMLFQREWEGENKVVVNDEVERCYREVERWILAGTKE